MSETGIERSRLPISLSHIETSLICAATNRGTVAIDTAVFSGRQASYVCLCSNTFSWSWSCEDRWALHKAYRFRGFLSSNRAWSNSCLLFLVLYSILALIDLERFFHRVLFASLFLYPALRCRISVSLFDVYSSTTRFHSLHLIAGPSAFTQSFIPCHNVSSLPSLRICRRSTSRSHPPRNTRHLSRVPKRRRSRSSHRRRSLHSPLTLHINPSGHPMASRPFSFRTLNWCRCCYRSRFNARGATGAYVGPTRNRVEGS